MMQIGWTDRMQPPKDLDEIPPALVAVNIEQLEQREESGSRRLQSASTENREALFKTRDGTFTSKMRIIEALQIEVVPISGQD